MLPGNRKLQEALEAKTGRTLEMLTDEKKTAEDIKTLFDINSLMKELDREKTQCALEALAKEAKQQEDSTNYDAYMSLLKQLNQGE